MNEPVAWIDKNTGKPRMVGFIQTDHDIPLYTHPAELTDEEILEIASEQYGHSVGLYGNHIGFAKAILRKAQEK